MAEVVVEAADLVVRLSPLEKLAAFRGNVRVPLAAVKSVEVDPLPWGALRGMRAPGTGIPGVIAYGVRRFAGGKDFAALRSRRPALRVDLDNSSPFGRLVVSVPDPEATAARLRDAGAPG